MPDLWTPGPWHIDDCDIDGPDGELVACFQDRMTWVNDGQIGADMQVIESAPRMVELLDRVMAEIRIGEDTEPLGRLYLPLIGLRSQAQEILEQVRRVPP